MSPTYRNPRPRPGRRSSLYLLLLPVVLAFQLFGSGCGATRKIAVGSMLPILQESVIATYRDHDLVTVEAGIPANLLLLRGLCETERGNDRLHALAGQLYFSYAYGFVEDLDPERAAGLYAEGLRLGRQGLAGKGWFVTEGPLEALAPRLREIGRDDVPLLFWTIANWSGWINLRLDDPAAVAQLGMVEAYLGRVLELEPDYFLGMPHVMLGAMQCFRPVMFGGKPEEGRAHIEEAQRISGNRMLLYHVFYAQYYCRQTLDADGFTQSLERVQNAPDDLLPEYRLFNEVAKRKAALLMEQKDDLF